MPVDIDFTKHDKVLAMIAESQDANQDQRDAAREAKLFINKRDGQWDPYAWNKMEGRYRGTFDMCTPIIDMISGEIDESDFTIDVTPAGGEADEDIADIYNGLIRNIKNISDADTIFKAASRSNVIGGFDAVEVVQEYVEGDSMDQDLIIKKIPNAIDSVWFDVGAVRQDAADANWAVKLIAIPTARYKEEYPDGSGQSVGDDKQSHAYYNTAEFVTIGQLYYKKKQKIEIVQMTDGAVYKVDDKFESVVDDLALQGITIATDSEGNEKRRLRNSYRVYSRLFDGGDWLSKEEQTVFDYLPIVPIYGNFDIFENKTIYFGKVEKLYDSQRALNYAISRDIEDGALSPSPTIWMTNKQAEGNDYSKMNTDRAPIRIYNADPEAPPVNGQSYTGGPTPSTGLQTTIQNTQQMIAASANSFNAAQGNAEPMQSGIAGRQQIEQGNIGSIKWFKALQTMERQVGKVLINAIPRVYDATRQVRVMEEDGSSKIIAINQVIFDQQTGRNVELNDLSKGEYDVVCDFGPAFNSQQKETAQAFLDMAAIDPSFLQQGKDILLKNLSVPGMDQMAERARVELFNAGLIPESQWTEKEQEQAQAQAEAAANQPPQEDPMMVAARAEEGKAQAAQMEAQNKQQQTQVDAQIKMASVQTDREKIALEREKLQLDVAMFEREGQAKYNKELISADQNQQKIDLQASKQMQEMALKLTDLEMKLGQQLDSQIQSNMLIFDPETGDFVQGNQ